MKKTLITGLLSTVLMACTGNLTTYEGTYNGFEVSGTDSRHQMRITIRDPKTKGYIYARGNDSIFYDKLRTKGVKDSKLNNYYSFDSIAKVREWMFQNAARELLVDSLDFKESHQSEAYVHNDSTHVLYSYKDDTYYKIISYLTHSSSRKTILRKHDSMYFDAKIHNIKKNILRIPY